MPNGILIIDKPAGWTSMDVCAKLRGLYHEKRVGHAGTLDPMATGVLPVFIGRATRGVEFADKSDKEYIAGLKLGVVTNTQDTTGEVLEQRPVTVTRPELEAVLAKFTGDIEQIPPMYSAVKIDGKKLYELARKGKEVERPPRPVTIHTLEITEASAVGRDDPIAPAPDTPSPGGSDYLLRVVCSKGTYVRTLCHDIGQALGCGGCMSALRRVKAAGFTPADAVTLEQVQAAPDPAALLRPVDSLFQDRKRVTLDRRTEKLIRNGMIAVLPHLDSGEYRAYAIGGEFLALCRCRNGKLSAIKSFFEPT